MLTKEQRQEMSDLSQFIFGSRSKWQKILERGATELLTTKVKETVPGENGEPDKEVEKVVPQLVNGARMSVNRRFTYEELRDLMIERKAAFVKAMADYEARQKTAQEAADKEKADKELELSVHNQATGSATY